MAVTTLAGLKQYIKRNLGDPVINIEIADSQLDDRIEEALNEFTEHHIDGTFESVYLLSASEDTKSYDLPSTIKSVTYVFSTNQYLNDEALLMQPLYMSNPSTESQIMEVSVSDMAFIRQRMALVEDFYRRELRYDFNPTTNVFLLYEAPSLDTTYALKVFQIETDVTKYYDNKWFKRYATALCGIQWGINITKYSGAPLPGGASLNGEGIESRYTDLKTQLEEELDRYREPADFYVG